MLYIGAVIFLFLLVKRPAVVAVIFFTITLADINFDLGGGSLNIRALIGLALFARTLIPEAGDDFPPYLSSAGKWIILFILYFAFVTAAYDLLQASFIKRSALTLVTAYTGYVYFFKRRDMMVLQISLILAGLICVGDLVYTYATVGKFPVQRIYMALMHIQSEVDERGDFIEVINHNFYGFICGICFVFLLNSFLNDERSNKLILIFLPIMFLGVLMSTSRSTLLGMIGISIFLLVRELRHRERAKKAATIIMVALGSIFMSWFAFVSLQGVFNIGHEFADRIALRLIDEPVAVMNKHLGMNYNAQSLDAMDWREEASANALEAYMNLSPMEQVFGIGFWGFRTRNLGHNNLPPHNGILMLVIEAGLVGLIFYFLIIGSIIYSSFRSRDDISPIVTTLVFVLIYCIGQNEEMTSGITFLFVATLAAENLMLRMEPEKDEEEEELVHEDEKDEKERSTFVTALRAN